jgi:hypothetical protein
MLVVEIPLKLGSMPRSPEGRQGALHRATCGAEALLIPGIEDAPVVDAAVLVDRAAATLHERRAQERLSESLRSILACLRDRDHLSILCLDVHGVPSRDGRAAKRALLHGRPLSAVRRCVVTFMHLMTRSHTGSRMGS